MTDQTHLSLTPEDADRFRRQMGLAGFGEEGQARLLKSRVAVVGAGGLGAPVLQYLAAAGVGHIEIIDDDVVERSNLHRQVIHSESDIGRLKAESAADVCRGLFPGIELTLHTDRLTADNALHVLRDADLVIDGTDSFDSRYLISDACEMLRKPVIQGSVLRFSGQVGVFWAGKTGTYRDLYPEAPDAGSTPTCAEAGVIGVLPGIIGTLMTMEAIKLLAGVGESALGSVLIYDGLASTMRTLTVAADPDRAPVEHLDSAAVITPAALEARLQAGQSTLLVDVREADEYAAGTIAGAHSVPLSALLEGAQLPESEAPLTVLFCQAGVRSLQALDILKARGMHEGAASLVGGINAV